MKNEKLLRAIGAISDDLLEEAAPKEFTEDILSHSKFKIGRHLAWFWRVHRVAALVGVVLLSISMTFATAFAASSTFRQAVISIFFPIYSDNEIKEIDNGHRTGSFDKMDVLFTFLEKFNSENMEDDLKAKKDRGFVYTLLPENENLIQAIVESEHPDSKILVRMERIAYEETTGLWQVVSYQIIDASTANKMKKDH
jgi:hypothetical protein